MIVTVGHRQPNTSMSNIIGYLYVRCVVWKGSWVRNLTWTHNERLGFLIYCREKPKKIKIKFTMMPDDT